MREYETKEITEELTATRKYPLLMEDINTDSTGSVNPIQRKTYLDV